MEKITILPIEEEEEEKPFFKRKHKYYKCECGKHLKVTSTIKTDWYGTLEHMRCSSCKENMVAQNDRFLGIAAKR